jgi:hypothetical protein
LEYSQDFLVNVFFDRSQSQASGGKPSDEAEDEEYGESDEWYRGGKDARREEAQIPREETSAREDAARTTLHQVAAHIEEF